MTAQASGSPLDFVQYGVLGLVLVALLLGWLWAKPAVDQLRKDYDRVVKQRDDLFRTMDDKVVPALLESNQITSALKPVMEDVVRVLEEVRQAVEAPRGRNA